ncbi:2682_t:CDS:2 [Dentiscutata erythropus]|uniref:2682_t:CDS:1 n=1 Tax=Dentiscutata erythropus TaxID=1348616 RepID=A0A9N9HDH1_9GLOM|nr:2682_t:CDS:2 [Dentiscutata erythropus]
MSEKKSSKERMDIADDHERIKEIAEQDTNRARIIALAVREACSIANVGPDRQDWESACRIILENNLLTPKEKTTIVALLIPSTQYAILSLKEKNTDCLCS